ncbi:hypothetical protein GJAV_G00227420 [Gymnothorax javanicus]|nr:hypothetical protein GJAV_G00227420 [Gymnothorax javanicus]
MGSIVPGCGEGVQLQPCIRYTAISCFGSRVKPEAMDLTALAVPNENAIPRASFRNHKITLRRSLDMC